MKTVYLNLRKCEYCVKLFQIINNTPGSKELFHVELTNFPKHLKGWPACYDDETGLCFYGDHAFEMIAQVILQASQTADDDDGDSAVVVSTPAPPLAAFTETENARAEVLKGMCKEGTFKSDRVNGAVRKQQGQDDGSEPRMEKHLGDQCASEELHASTPIHSNKHSEKELMLINMANASGMKADRRR